MPVEKPEYLKGEFLHSHHFTQLELARIEFFQPENIRRVVERITPGMPKQMRSVLAEEVVDLIHQTWHRILFGYDAGKKRWKNYFYGKVRYAVLEARGKLFKRRQRSGQSIFSRVDTTAGNAPIIVETLLSREPGPSTRLRGRNSY